MGFVTSEGGRIPALMRIGTQRETRGIWIDGLGGFQDEAEWLLRRGTRFRVRRIRELSVEDLEKEFPRLDLDNLIVLGSRRDTLLRIVDLEIL